MKYLCELLLFLIGASRPTSAAEMVVGPRIDLWPTTFALPINIIDGAAVADSTASKV